MGGSRQPVGWASSTTCWKVGRLVARIVSGMSPGVKLVRAAGLRQVRGSGPCGADDVLGTARFARLRTVP